MDKDTGKNINTDVMEKIMDILQNEIKQTLAMVEKCHVYWARGNGKQGFKENFLPLIKMALEKQVEAEPINGSYCPKCGRRILQQRQIYCGYCGQRVKRSE